MQIVMTGRAGDLGSYKLAREHEELISSRFPAAFISGIEGLAQSAEAGESIDGVYQQLWRLGEETGSGLEVYHESIPIAQQSIEICELLEINPYEIETSGRIFLLNEGESAGQGRIIGRLTAGKARVIISKSGTRFLTHRFSSAGI